MSSPAVTLPTLAATAAPSRPILENRHVSVFYLPPRDERGTTRANAARWMAQELVGKGVSRAVAKATSAAIGQLAGFAVGVVTQAGSVGNATRVRASVLSESGLGNNVCTTRHDLRPLVLFNHSDTFNAGVTLVIERREGLRWKSVLCQQLMTRDEVRQLDKHGPPGSLYLVVPRRGVRLDRAGSYRLTVTARSRDGRASHRFQVVKYEEM